MNVFLPFENSVRESVQALDDVRLNKSAVECYQLLAMAEREKEFGEPTSKGHYHHPVYQFYKSNPQFLAYYGYYCCREYFYRFNKILKSIYYFDNILDKYKMFQYDEDGYITSFSIPQYTPYYMEGSKDSPNCIRTTENVSKLFQNKLIKKWESDIEKGRPPKWTNRKIPEFYKNKKKEKKDDNI